MVPPPTQNTMGVCNQIALLILHYTSSRLVTLLKVLQYVHSPYSCEVCNRAFSRKSDIIRHQRLHSGERPYVCDVCNKAYSYKSNLIKHKRKHSGERPYVCEVCNKAFSQKRSLKSHQRTHSDEGAHN